MRENKSSQPDELMAALKDANPVDISTLPSPQGEEIQNTLQEILMSNQDGGPIHIGSDPNSRAKFSSKTQKYDHYQKRSRSMMAVAAVFILFAVSALVVIKPWGTSSASAVQEAASQSKKAQTGKAVVSASIVEDSETEELGEVVVRFDGRDLEVALTAADVGEEWNQNLKYVDGTVYVQDGNSWIGFEAPDFAQQVVGAYADPGKVFEVIEELTDVEEVGSKNLEGVEVSHYSGVVPLKDLSTVALQAFGLSGMGDFESEVSTLEGQINLDIYIDDQGFIQQVDSVVEHPEETSKLVGSVVFSDLGGDINIEAPKNFERIPLDEELFSAFV